MATHEIEHKAKELGKFKGWRLLESKKSDGTPFYMAYYYISPNKAPAMLHHSELEKLKLKIEGIRFYKGKLNYVSQKAREI